MGKAHVSIAGHGVTTLRVTVGNVGPWVADADFEEAPDVSGRVSIKVGTAELLGTVVPASSGTHGLQRRVRIVGGGGGWARAVAAKNYHNDAGVKARTVADDAARAVGETIGSFVPRAERVGSHYVRQAVAASVALEDVLGGAPWWVDYAGVTHAGPRPAAQLQSGAYEVLAYDPRDRLVTLGVDDVAAVQIGATLSERLDGPQTVRSLELVVNSDELRMMAWCGGDESAPSLLPGLLRAIAQHSASGKLWGKYRYRAMGMDGARVQLQAVRKAAGLPDVLPVSMWPGVAGAHAQLADGAEVLVEFVEGDRAQPVITHFAGKDGPGFVPTSLTLGGDTGAPAARSGDTVEVLLPPAIFTGTINGAPASGVLAFPLNKTSGVITTGSSKVEIAT